MLDTSKRSWHDDEFVEDSEPERQAKRQRTREQARLARKKTCPSLPLQQADQPDQDVIELADAECNLDGPTSAAFRPQSLVDKLASGEPVVLCLEPHVALTPISQSLGSRPLL